MANVQDQIALFEPTGAEVGQLVTLHLRRAEKNRREADVFLARGFLVLAHQRINAADAEESEAECLAMLAEFEALGGVGR